MSQGKTGETFMDNDNIRIKIWPTLTRIYHLFTAKFVPNICMIWTWIKKVSKTVSSSVWQVYQDVPYYFTLCCQMVRSFIDCLSQRFSKNVMIEPKCRICRLTSYSCGTVLVIGLLFIALIGWLA